MPFIVLRNSWTAEMLEEMQVEQGEEVEMVDLSGCI